MATVQKQRTRQRLASQKTDTAVAQSVTVLQSQQLAQIFVHASISMIAHLRDLFHSDCFRRRPTDLFMKLADYKDYISTSSQLAGRNSFADDRAGYETLVRGADPTVDALLDQLNCAFRDAHEKKNLKALVVAIGIDSDHPENVMESYTFTFSYQSTANGSRSLSGVEVSDDSNTVSMLEAKRSIGSMLNFAVESCKSKPLLPPDRCITVHLIHTNDWDGTLAQGFRTAGDALRYASVDGWERASFNPCGKVLDLGYQGVSVGVARLKPAADSGILDEGSAWLPDASDGIAYVDDSAALMVNTNIDAELSNARSHNLRLRSNNGVANQRPTRTRTKFSRRATTNGTDLIPNSQVSANVHEDLSVQRRLNAMLAEQSIGAIGGDTQVLSSLPASQLSPEKQPVSDEVQKVKFSASVLRGFGLDNGDRAGADTAGGSSDEVICLCTSTAAEHDICCAACGVRYHLRCYGYHDSLDPRIPETFICYPCLLSDEKPLLEELKTLALMRSAAQAFHLKKCSKESELKSQLDCDMNTAKRLVEALIKKGFLHRVPVRKGVRGVEFVDESADRYLTELFDPTLMITHKLALPGISQLPLPKDTTQMPSMPPQLDTLRSPTSRFANSLVGPRTVRTPAARSASSTVDEFDTPFVRRTSPSRAARDILQQFQTPKSSHVLKRPVAAPVDEDTPMSKRLRLKHTKGATLAYQRQYSER